MGYHRAGFDEIVGVDIEPQPHYPFTFVQGDALNPPVRLEDFDLIHASPPCQLYSVANNVHQKDHPDLVPATRALINQFPYIIENVPGAPLINPVILCGLTLGLNVKRHRLFETSFHVLVPPCPKGHPGDWLLVFGHSVMERGHVVRKTPAGHNTTHRKHTTTARGRDAMGIDWMNRDELSEAIPPAYTQFLGEQFLASR